MDRISELVAIMQQLDRDLLAIEIIRSGITTQQAAIRSTSLFSDDGTPITKNEFKELGAAGMIAGQVGIEAIVGLVANAIETFSIRLKRHLDTNWEPFTKPSDDVPYSSSPRFFRALNNVYKHQEGYVDAAESRSAKHLVESGYFKDATYLKHLPPEAVVPEAELRIYEAFAHMYQVCSDASGLSFQFCSDGGEKLVERLRERAIYPIIRPKLGVEA